MGFNNGLSTLGNCAKSLHRA